MSTIAPFAPVPIYDAFSRAADLTAGHERWGVMDSGTAWRDTTASIFDITFDLSDPSNPIGEGTISIASTQNYGVAWISFDSAGLPNTTTSGEVLASLKWSSASAKPETDIGVALNRSSDETFYYASLHDATGEMSIGVYANGVRHELARRSKSFKVDTKYWMRFQRDATKLYLKVWQVGTVEPSGWSLGADEYTGSHKPTDGVSGIFYNGTSSLYHAAIDSVYFYTKTTLDNEPPKPVSDLFARSLNRGWGKTTTGHTWEGHLGDDPRAPTTIGYVSGGSGLGRFTNTGNYWGFVGPATTSAIETAATFQINTNSTTNKVYLYFGLHGQSQFTDGVLQGVGYAARVTSGGNVLGIYKTTTFAGSWTLISQVTLGFSLAANTDYKIKFQKTGTTLRAACWLSSGSMPSIWDVTTTDASITAGGQTFIQFTQDTDATRTVSIDSWTYGPLTVLTGGTPITVQTTTGTYTLTATDSSINYTARYTDDTNNNNTCVVEYKKASASTWTTAGAATQNTGSTPKTYSGTITGLESFTRYQVRVTFSDSDDVQGTNPLIDSIVTSALRSKLGRLYVDNVGTTTADLYATYTFDTNNNATMGLQKRAFGSYTDFFKNDFYVANGGIALEGQAGSNSSDVFIENSLMTTTQTEIRASAGRAYLRTTDGSAGNTGHRSYLVGDFVGQSQMTMTAKFMIQSWGIADLSFIFRADPATNTFYDLRVGSGTGKVFFGLVKWVSGSATTVINSDVYDIELGEFQDIAIRLADVSGDNQKIVYYNGVEVLKSTDNSITTPHGMGFGFTSNVGTPMTNDVSPIVYDFRVDGRPSSGSWGGSTAMTAYSAGTGPFDFNDHRYFYLGATGLSLDTFYEYKVTITDSDGTTGDTTDTVTFQTHGNKAYLDVGNSVTIKSYPTSAVITTVYSGDSDDDSSLMLQYRLAGERIWSTAPTNFTTVNRGTNRFRTTLSGLRPSATYEIKVILSDPDGIEEHQTDTDYGSFTTQTIIRAHDKPLKNYQWKVYDSVTGRYIESWPDAGSPKFTFEENSGVSDLTVRLPRAVSSLNELNSSISHQNIVDIWVHDIFEDGLGPNMLEDEDFTLGKWTFTAIPDVCFYHETQGVIGDRCIKIDESGSTVHEILSEEIYVDPLQGIHNNAPETYKNRQDFRHRTFICSIYAKANSADGGRLVMGVFEYGEDGTGSENVLSFSDIVGETVGNEWQKLQIPFTITNPNTKYIRISAKNDGAGTYWIDEGKITAKEQLLYSGHIETITSNIEDNGEYIDIEIFGEAAVLSDDYVEFLQFVERPQQRDRVYDSDGTPLLDAFGVELAKTRYGATDPANMMKYVIDIAQHQNPKCRLYYTEDSIHNTGVPDAQYTFREKQLRDVFDQIRDLCPSGWHYVIMPDGLVILRGPEHVRTHVLRVGVEVTKFKQSHTIKDLKNVIYFKGRQDEDFSEGDGYGSITAELHDQKSIDQYGRRVLFTQDASIVDPQTANTYIEGRLTEVDQAENQISCDVIDEKAVLENQLGFKGYNIESFIPGDYVILLNPRAAPNKTYWDQAVWDQSLWDYSSADVLVNQSVPIKSITYDDASVTLSLSQRPPSFTSDFQKLSRKSQQNDSEK